MSPLLEVDGVMVGFNGLQVLSNVYLKCSMNEVLGILGRNGTGKSTLFKTIFGTLRAQSSSIRIDGKALLGTARNPLDIRYLPQFSFVPAKLSLQRVMDFFDLGFEGLIERFPIFEGHQNHKMKTLSGGERRLVELYCILKSNSRLVILDEPFSYLMPIHVEKVKEMIYEEKQRKGIICSDHQYKHVFDVSDRLMLLDRGVLASIDSCNDLVRSGYLPSL